MARGRGTLARGQLGAFRGAVMAFENDDTSLFRAVQPKHREEIERLRRTCAVLAIVILLLLSALIALLMLVSLQW